MELKDYTIDELEEEILRRKLQIPTMIPMGAMNIKNLRNLCSGYVKLLATGNTVNKTNREHTIYETAMETVYGPKIWKWMKSLPNG